MQTHLGVTCLPYSNESILCFVKATPDNMVIVAISTDPVHPQSGTLRLAPEIRNFAGTPSLRLEELMRDRDLEWPGDDPFIALDPASPFAIWRVRPALES